MATGKFFYLGRKQIQDPLVEVLYRHIGPLQLVDGFIAVDPDYEEIAVSLRFP